MAVLDHWRHLLNTPKTLTCKKMKLLARDHEEPIIIGTGEFNIIDNTTFRYTLRGRPADAAYTFHQLKRQRENPYESLMRFRLVFWDEGGVEYAGGWTVPHVEPGSGDEWIFSGETHSGPWLHEPCDASESNATELIFAIPRGSAAALCLSRFVRMPHEGMKHIPEYVLHTLGSDIAFHYDSAVGLLSVNVPASAQLPLTFTENWIAEPLRIMFGQLIYPRLVARNLPDGFSHISLRPAPDFSDVTGWLTLWSGENALTDQIGFWNLYAQILSYVALSRDSGGDPNFDRNKLTRLYEEVIQAASGSRWVWALTTASSVEAITRKLISPDATRPGVDMEAIKALSVHIDAWKGDQGLKSAAVGAVKRQVQMTAKRALVAFKDRQVITAEQLDAWETLRNSVMHGSLVPPYSTESEDAQMLALAGLLHALTRELVRVER
ncbi:hypothetical protein NKL07_00130 [Mesorhizobium sp. C280B]|uniref:hypothetical protein n=1 Tax=unclassified Mesorhizobium TaxID=325217 RepID=UPI000404CB62|nr:hypothetical protein [Mesorhizobium sp. LSJC280B00]